MVIPAKILFHFFFPTNNRSFSSHFCEVRSYPTCAVLLCTTASTFVFSAVMLLRLFAQQFSSSCAAHAISRSSNLLNQMPLYFLLSTHALRHKYQLQFQFQFQFCQKPAVIANSASLPIFFSVFLIQYVVIHIYHISYFYPLILLTIFIFTFFQFSYYYFQFLLYSFWYLQ